MRAFLLFALLGFATGALAGADPFAKAKPEFLPVDEAFEIQPLVWKDGVLEVSWRIHKDYYLYRDRLKFTATAATLKLGKPVLPASLPHEDEHFGTVQVYRDKLVVQVPATAEAKGGISIKVVYQGCADAGLCYPPQTRTLEAGT